MCVIGSQNTNSKTLLRDSPTSQIMRADAHWRRDGDGRYSASGQFSYCTSQPANDQPAAQILKGLVERPQFFGQRRQKRVLVQEILSPLALVRVAR